MGRWVCVCKSREIGFLNCECDSGKLCAQCKCERELLGVHKREVEKERENVCSKERERGRDGQEERLCEREKDVCQVLSTLGQFFPQRHISKGGSPGLVVGMGGDSCSEGCGFESQHRILDGHVSHLFVIKVLLFV